MTICTTLKCSSGTFGLIKLYALQKQVVSALNTRKHFSSRKATMNAKLIIWIIIYITIWMPSLLNSVSNGIFPKWPEDSFRTRVTASTLLDQTWAPCLPSRRFRVSQAVSNLGSFQNTLTAHPPTTPPHYLSVHVAATPSWCATISTATVRHQQWSEHQNA